MDFQSFIHTITIPACVLSVEKTESGTCGAIHIICSNSQYKEAMGPAYYDGMLYHELVPKDLKFEDYCFRAAHFNQRMHAYVETVALNCWTDQQMIPLVKENDRIGYCLFFFEFTREADSERMAEVSVTTAAAVIQCCINLMGAENFETGIFTAAETIRKFADAAACRVILLDHKNKAVRMVSESTEGSSLIRDETHDGTISYDIVCSWEPMIGVSNDLIIKNETEMADAEKRNPAWVATMKEYGVKTLVLIPLRRKRAIVGYLYAVNFDTSKVVEVKEMIELMSFFLGTEIYNYQLMNRLEEMGRTDGLTGLQNRNAMREVLEQISSRKPAESFGIANMDLNGLKTVNDCEGHDAGDQLLLAASEQMKQVFGADALFRTGGDEFIAIVQGCTKEAFQQKVQQMRQAEQNGKGVSIAVGACWVEEYTGLREALRNADEDMYLDKQNYYRTHTKR